MNWLFFALLAPAIYAVVVFIDKYIVSRGISDYRCMPIYVGIMGFLGGTVVWILTNFPILDLIDALMVFLAGILTAVSTVVYYKAIMQEEASKINIYFQIGPVLISIFAYLILGERLSSQQFAGFILITSAIIAISQEHRKSRNILRISPALLLIFYYDIMWAASAILMKFALGVNSLSKIISYQSWGVTMGSLIIFLTSRSIRHAFLMSLQTIKVQTVGAIATNEALFILARSLTYFAYILGPLALVSVLEGTQIYFGIFYGWFLMSIAPSIFREDISIGGLKKKFFFATILLTGIWLIS